MLMPFLAPQSRVSVHQGLLSLVSAPLQAGVIVAAPFYLGTAPMLGTQRSHLSALSTQTLPRWPNSEPPGWSEGELATSYTELGLSQG